MFVDIILKLFLGIFFKYKKIGLITAAKKTQIIDLILKLFLGLSSRGKMKNFSIFLTNVGKFLISGVISFSKSYFFYEKNNFWSITSSKFNFKKK